MSKSETVRELRRGAKKMREELMNRMIRLYGFESPITIDFCRLCEEWADTEAYDNALARLVKCNEETPLYFEEE